MSRRSGRNIVPLSTCSRSAVNNTRHRSYYTIMPSLVTNFLIVSIIALILLLIGRLYIPHSREHTELLIKPLPQTQPIENVIQYARDINMGAFRSVLKPILIERVVGTVGHEIVKNYIAGEMTKLRWDIEMDEFNDRTPDGKELTFTNVIATFNPFAPRFLVFACHYDSKLMDFAFIGATDSAVPCAMMIYLAQNMNSLIYNIQQDVSLKFIFFDGEEAFIKWSSTDSLYGSRHLAKQFANKRSIDSSKQSITELDRMSLLVLLDLLGTSSPTFYSYFQETNSQYSKLVQVEKKLHNLKLIKNDVNGKLKKYYFKSTPNYYGTIDDDHRPFMERGVPVLHIIPSPFPTCWHRPDDNESVINYDTVYNLLVVFKVFIIDYLVDSSSQ